MHWRPIHLYMVCSFAVDLFADPALPTTDWFALLSCSSAIDCRLIHSILIHVAHCVVSGIYNSEGDAQQVQQNVNVVSPCSSFCFS